MVTELLSAIQKEVVLQTVDAILTGTGTDKRHRETGEVSDAPPDQLITHGAAPEHRQSSTPSPHSSSINL